MNKLNSMYIVIPKNSTKYIFIKNILDRIDLT